MKTKFLLDFTPDNAKEPCVQVYEVKVTYCQNSDTNQSDDLGQTLEVWNENNGMGENGIYFAMKTDRWTFDDESQFLNILKDYKHRLKVNTVKKKNIKTY